MLNFVKTFYGRITLSKTGSIIENMSESTNVMMSFHNIFYRYSLLLTAFHYLLGGDTTVIVSSLLWSYSLDLGLRMTDGLLVNQLLRGSINKYPSCHFT